eukprot:jgi/Chlat1/2113/Chrsp17S02700
MSCPICSGSLTDRSAEDYAEPYASRVCGHVYHQECIYKWLECAQKPACPICKQRCGLNDVIRLFWPAAEDERRSSALAVTTTTRSEDEGHAPQETLHAVNHALASQLRGKIECLQRQVERLQDELKEHQDTRTAMRKELDQYHCRHAELKSAVRDAVREKMTTADALSGVQQNLIRTREELQRLRIEKADLQSRVDSIRFIDDADMDEAELESLLRSRNVHDAVRILQRSLACRNKEYTKLVAKYELEMIRMTDSKQHGHESYQQLEKEVSTLRKQCLKLKAALKNAKDDSTANKAPVADSVLCHAASDCAEKPRETGEAPVQQSPMTIRWVKSAATDHSNGGMCGDQLLVSRQPLVSLDNRAVMPAGITNAAWLEPVVDNARFVKSGADGRGGRRTVVASCPANRQGTFLQHVPTAKRAKTLSGVRQAGPSLSLEQFFVRQKG